MTEFINKDEFIDRLVETYSEFENITRTVERTCSKSEQAKEFTATISLWLRVYSRSIISRAFGTAAIPDVLTDGGYWQIEI